MKIFSPFLDPSLPQEKMSIKEVISRFSEDKDKIFSPWKNEDRLPSGIAHALYVFTVIHVALPLLNSNENFIDQRRLEIENEINLGR